MSESTGDPCFDRIRRTEGWLMEEIERLQARIKRLERNQKILARGLDNIRADTGRKVDDATYWEVLDENY